MCSNYLLEGEVSWFAVGERLAAAAVLTILYLWTRKKVDKIRPETEALWKTYLCGVCAYLLSVQQFLLCQPVWSHFQSGGMCAGGGSGHGTGENTKGCGYFLLLPDLPDGCEKLKCHDQ